MSPEYPIKPSFRRGLYEVNYDEEFGRRRRSRSQPWCSNCRQRESAGRCRFGFHLCHACEETELEFIRTVHPNKLSRKNQRPTSNQEENSMSLFDRWKPDQGQREQLRRGRRWQPEPCSHCGQPEETAYCVCGKYFCINCIDRHFTEDDPDFCPALREHTFPAEVITTAAAQQVWAYLYEEPWPDGWTVCWDDYWDDPGDQAECDQALKQIRLNWMRLKDTDDEDEILFTLVHELIHLRNTFTGLSVGPNPEPNDLAEHGPEFEQLWVTTYARLVGDGLAGRVSDAQALLEFKPRLDAATQRFLAQLRTLHETQAKNRGR
jgi:hypothetical protein